MAGTNGSGPLVEGADGPVGKHVTDAFKLLSDENRLAILVALWDAYDPHADSNIVSFTDLYHRVTVEDSGNFSYHLDKLVGHFVEEADEGYRLSNAGQKIVRAVIAGAGLEERSLPPTDIPRSCQRCGSPVEIRYEDQRLILSCTACEGKLGPHSTERTPAGTLVVHDGFNPSGLVGRTPEEVFVAATIEYHRIVTMIIRGICPECSGPIEESLRICEDHSADPGQICPSCGTGDEARVSYVCSVCKYDISYPAWVAAFDHPAIVSFLYDHGFEGAHNLEDAEAAGRVWERLFRTQELVSRDPVRIQVTLTDEGEALELALDGELDVIDIQGPRQQREPESIEA